jgi:hypothetical protein
VAWITDFVRVDDKRRYGTQQSLPDGRSLVLGGRRAFSYEFVPPAGQSNPTANPLQILRDTTDDVENNLYPFVHLLPDGNLFIFANDRSVVFDPRTGQVVRELPVLPGGGRNYPASGMSALLPLDLRRGEVLSPEVIVCSGGTKAAFKLGETNNFPNKRHWRHAHPPHRRPAHPQRRGQGLLRVGLRAAVRADPVPVLAASAATTIPRMYHASSALLPDATVLVAGGNTNSAYNFSGVDFPTEVRAERFSPRSGIFFPLFFVSPGKVSHTIIGQLCLVYIYL